MIMSTSAASSNIDYEVSLPVNDSFRVDGIHCTYIFDGSTLKEEFDNDRENIFERKSNEPSTSSNVTTTKHYYLSTTKHYTTKRYTTTKKHTTTKRKKDSFGKKYRWSSDTLRNKVSDFFQRLVRYFWYRDSFYVKIVSEFYAYMHVDCIYALLIS